MTAVECAGHGKSAALEGGGCAGRGARRISAGAERIIGGATTDAWYGGGTTGAVLAIEAK